MCVDNVKISTQKIILHLAKIKKECTKPAYFNSGILIKIA